MTFEPSQLTGIVLAGGQSTRLGSTQSKLITCIDGKKILIRIAEALKPVTSKLILVLHQNQNDEVFDLGISLNMHVVSDTEPYSGPLAGIHAGLTASITPFSFVVAGDHPFLSSNLITTMAVAAGLDESKAACAVIPYSEGNLHPLHAIYPRKYWVSHFGHALSEGETSPRRSIEKARVANYPPVTIFTDEDISQTDPDKISLFDIDTPENLSFAKQIAEAQSSKDLSDHSKD
tara:strand:+ start:153 stop:851 length:699 start_codon:yes stop_codon:yes gene_type:complete